MSDTSTPDLSIIIPAYNEELRLPRTLRAVTSWIDRGAPSTEVVVVENGSTDRTVETVQAFQADHPAIRLIADVPRGKGRAVRRGMLAARGGRRFLCDADLSMPIAELDKFLAAADAGADVVIGSRDAPGAVRIGEPRLRHFMGRVFNTLVKVVVVRGFEDTQCGFKLFSGDAAKAVFAKARLSGWGFDPEVLFIARKHGYRIVEVPIEWHSDRDSRVRPLRDALAMIRELLAIRRNDMRGAYDRPGDAAGEGRSADV